MPVFTFDGFSQGSAVAISAVQGSNNASGSVPTWGQENLASLNILQVVPGELVAPVGIWFEAIDISGFNVAGPGPGAVYDPLAHEVNWIWDFDDPGSFTAPLNIPTAWNNKNVDYGKKSYHAFDQPGTYNIRLWGIDSQGTTGEKIVAITILDPNAVYPGTRTICVSTSGDFTGAPTGANNVTTLAAAESAAYALGQTCRILLRSGDAFQEQFDINTPMINARIGSFGAGAKPVLRPPVVGPNENNSSIFRFRNGNTVVDSVFYGLRFEGEWDAATETGDPRGKPISYSTHNTVAFNTLVYQCEIDGMASLNMIAVADNDHISAVVDCDITNWQDYGLLCGVANYLETKKFAIVGTAIHQKLNACAGGQGKIGLCNDHGPLRYSDMMNTVISACDFYTANSWATGIQPCMRLAQSDSNNPGGYFVNINRVVCEGGTEFGGISGQNSGAPQLPGNHIMDMFLHVSSYATTKGFLTTYGGTTVRNGLVVRPNMNYQVGAINMMDFESDNPGAGNLMAPMDVYNCTFLNMDESGTTNIVESLTDFSNYIFENNVIHEPNLGSPNTPNAPIDLSTDIVGFTPRNPGPRASVEKVQVSISSVAPGGTVTIPYPSGTSASDFSTSGRNTVFVNAALRYFSYRGEVGFVFGGSNITITNTSSDTWASGALRLGLEQTTLTTDATYASPATIPVPIPQPGSNAMNNLGGARSYSTLFGDPRSGPWGGAV